MAETEKNENTTEEESKKNQSSNIPAALFIDNLDEYMSKPENEVSNVLKLLDEQHCKYKFMETNLATKKKKAKSQIPDLERSLAVIDAMKKNASEGKKDMICDFLVSDEVYSQAKVETADTVFLWLGANVMLEYKLDEAVELLTKNIENAKTIISHTENDLQYLRDQRIITEVTMARVYNWDVNKRRDAS